MHHQLSPFIASSNHFTFVEEVAECLSEASFRPRHKSEMIWGLKAIVGCPFLWFVSFGHAKEMNAQRQRIAQNKLSFFKNGALQ